MDANKFMSEFRRICDSYDRCSDCPLGQGRRICSYYPSHYTQETISAAIKTVEEWSTAHPRKTRQSVFLEQWPEAKRVDNILAICPKVLNMSLPCWIYNNANVACEDCRREFWMQEVEVK